MRLQVAQWFGSCTKSNPGLDTCAGERDTMGRRAHRPFGDSKRQRSIRRRAKNAESEQPPDDTGLAEPERVLRSGMSADRRLPPCVCCPQSSAEDSGG